MGDVSVGPIDTVTSLLQQAGSHSHIEQVNTADYWLPQRRPQVYIFALHHSCRADHHWVPILHNLLSASKGATPCKIAEVLKVVQTFDPPGVGARDLRECLMLQLERAGRQETLEGGDAVPLGVPEEHDSADGNGGRNREA